MVTVALTCTEAPPPGAGGAAGFAATTAAANTRGSNPDTAKGKRAIYHTRNRPVRAVPQRDTAQPKCNPLAGRQALC